MALAIIHTSARAKSRAVVTESHEEAVEEARVRNRVSHAAVHERREVTPAVLKVVRPIPCRMTYAKALFLVAGRCTEVDGGSIVERVTRVIPLQVRASVA